MDDSRLLSEARTIVQLVLIDETGDSYYRMRWPGRDVARQAPNWRVLSIDARAEERLVWAEEADLLIIYQSNDLDLLPLIERRRKQGKKTLAEYNDNFYAPPPASPVAEAWSSPLIWQSYERLMHQCDGVIVTGPGLQQLFKKRTNTPLYILENHLPFVPEDFDKIWQRKSPTVNLGWAGSLGHISDVLAIAPILREVMELCPELTLHIMGNDAIPGMLHIPADRLQFTNWGTMTDYYNFWKPIQIGFAPLLDTPYNNCRSDIKAVEMAAVGVLPILTEALPYRSFLKETKSPSFKTSAELKSLLLNYVKDRKKLEENAERAFSYVKTKRIGVERKERLNLYLGMLTAPPSSFAWPFAAGYHELQGTNRTEMSYGAVLKSVQASIDQGNRVEAQVILDRALEENPYLAEVAVAAIKNLRALNQPQLPQRLEEYLERFPLDLRFQLLKTAMLRAENRLSCWKELLAKVKAQPRPYADFFQRDVVKLYCRQLPSQLELLQVAPQILKLFPDSAELHFQLAHSYEQAGNDQQSLFHFNWLIETRKKATANQEFFGNSQQSYMQSWADCLEARVKGLRTK